MKKIFIMYDQGYEEITKEDFKNTFNILEPLDLTLNTEVNKEGLLKNSVLIPTLMNGKRITLTELFLSETNYKIAIDEINAGEEPVLFIKSKTLAFKLKCRILN